MASLALIREWWQRETGLPSAKISHVREFTQIGDGDATEIEVEKKIDN